MGRFAATHRTGCDRRRYALALGIVLALVAVPAAAVFIVSEPWVRPAASVRTTEAYMVLTSTEGATLVGARSEIAVGVATYAAGKNPVRIERLPLPAGQMVKLHPGGLRLGLRDLARPLKLGDRVPLVLTIEAADGKRQEIPVNAEVRRRSPIDDELRAHKH